MGWLKPPTSFIIYITEEQILGSQKFPVIGVGFRRISQGLESSRMFTCHLPRVVAQGPKGKMERAVVDEGCVARCRNIPMIVDFKLKECHIFDCLFFVIMICGRDSDDNGDGDDGGDDGDGDDEDHSDMGNFLRSH